MVGHTGDIEATIVACKAADEAVKVWCFTFLYVLFSGINCIHFQIGKLSNSLNRHFMSAYDNLNFSFNRF